MVFFFSASRWKLFEEHDKLAFVISEVVIVLYVNRLILPHGSDKLASTASEVVSLVASCSGVHWDGVSV